MTTVEPDVRRLDVVDLGRGAVMALMALDHTRTFLTNVTYNPSDLTRTFPTLFLTRWISHYCTPMFLFLAGAGVFFMVERRHPAQAAGRLVTRGFALIVLELTVVRWGWYFNLDVAWLLTSPYDRGAVSVPTGWGLDLPAIYASTLVLLVALYPVSRRFAELKVRSRSAWLSYL